MTDDGPGAPASITGRAAVRVLWLVKGLGPGGAERLLVDAAGAHDRARFHFECAYLLPWKDALRGPLEEAGVRTTCLEVRREQDLRWAARLRRLLRARPVDVLHAHSPYPAAVARLVVRTLPRALRPRLVYTTHNGWGSFRAATRVLNGLTLPLDDADLVVSGEAHASIWPRLRPRVEVLVHGIDVERVAKAAGQRDAVRDELGIGPGEVVAGTVANFRAQKDYPNLLAAARALAEQEVSVRIVAVGQGPLEAEIRALHARSDLGDRVLLLGRRDDAVRVMAACDLFVLASAWEGLPVAVMEALALGLPVVATAVGGLPEMVDEGVEGLLVPPGRPDLLAAAVAGLAGDADRRAAMARAARARSGAFDVAHAVARIEQVYDEVVRAR